jgi:hypothetical protein
MRWILLLSAIAAWSQPAPGRWDGTVLYDKLKVPFTLKIDGKGATLTGTLVNGEAHVPSTSATFESNRLQLTFGADGPKLDAKLADNELKGTFNSQPFTAAPYCTCGMEGVAGPSIEGAWEIRESGWRLDIKRRGEDTLATVTSADQNVGPLNGRYDGLTFQLHYFDGTRAAVLELEERKDGGLDIVWMEPGKEPVKAKAVRVSAAR